MQDPGSDPYVPGRGDPSYAVRHYDLRLAYGVDRNRLEGHAELDVEILHPTDRLRLDLVGLRVGKVLVDGTAPARHRHHNRHLTVHLGAEAAAGHRLSLRVTYSGNPHPVVDRTFGDAGWEELTDGSLVAAQPHGAATWYPCNDRPDDKATYRLAITVASPYEVAAAGTLQSAQRGGSSRTWEFTQDAPTPTYLMAVQIGRGRRIVQEASVPMEAVVPLGQEEAFHAAFGRQPEMLAAFEERFGPYPFDGYTVFIADDDLEIPLESQSLSTFGRNFLSTDWEEERLIAHELAHQWFGNSLTVRRWQDIWLHEGFACYAEWLWSEASGRRTAAEHAAHHWSRLDRLDQDLVLGDPGPRDMFDDRVYKRGALTLQALRSTVGDDAFFALLRDWAAEHRHGQISTTGFVNFALGHTGADLDALFTRWLWSAPLPPLPS